MSGPSGRIKLAIALIALSLQTPALAFGPAGHRIAGEIATSLLCMKASAEIEALTGGESLAEIGLWADRIRDEDEWRHTGPWHFMNIDDGVRISAYESPPDGDVLWAIEQHTEMLGQPEDRERRAEALRFLVHFVVDVHQPLHAGRASDRGGNTIDVRYRGEMSNLHRFWDTDVVRIEGLPESEYVARITPLARVFAGRDHTSPKDWAAESLELRSVVYDFGRQAGRDVVTLDEAYLETAKVTTRVRLAQAAVRLAATLNGLLGDPGCERRR